MPDVRLRIAPSPTGSLHIGGVRTMLYNYLFAKQRAGALILRVEDTDRERFVASALDSIYDGLHFVGVTWTEGPREGGPYGPYVQSERVATYAPLAERLVADGAAYFCFCSVERLASMRQQQTARGEITRYDRLCRAIEPARAAERARTESHVVRLKIPDDGVIGIDDLVHGHVAWPLASIEDQVLLKSDGFPTYQLAVVIDDHEMKISHVIRGEEWLPSTPKHLLVYRAFGWEVPPHAHVPDVLGPDGKKLSKRHGATAVEEFKAAGYLPEALVNFLALIGWSPGTEEEIFSMAQLVERWSIDRVQAAGGKWDKDRLDHFNGVYIRALSDDELAKRLGSFVPAAWDPSVIRAATPSIKERIVTLAEAPGLLDFLFTDALVYDATGLKPAKRGWSETGTALARARDVLASLDPFDATTIEPALRALTEELGWKVGELFMAVRVAVTGKKVTPPLDHCLALLGRERALARIDAALARLREVPA